MSKRVSLNRLYAAYAEDPALVHLLPGSNGVVPGDGPTEPLLVFVGEAPGRQENRQRKPFVGSSGRFLDEMLASVRLPRDRVFITNAVKIWPHDETGHNRTPTEAELQASIPYLRKEHRILGSRPLVVLGKSALKATARLPYRNLQLGPPELGMERGEWNTALGVPMLPLYHPAYGVYQQANRPMMFDMFRKVLEVL